MTARRSLNVKVAVSVLVAFAVSMAFSWFLHNSLSERDAYALIDRAFANARAELTDCINERLVVQCMEARERIEDGHPDDTASLQALARELRVSEVSIVDDKGDIVRSSVPDYLAGPGRKAFNFAEADDKDANKMMGLIDGRYTEYCQPYRSNAANGNWRKFVGVWRREGGFFEIGLDGKALQSLARSTCVDRFRTGASAAAAASWSPRRPGSCSPTTRSRTARARSSTSPAARSTGSAATSRRSRCT